MENDFEHGQPSPADARAALSSLDADGARLAQHVVTPWWYHPALGAVVALLTGAQALPMPVAIVLVAVGIAALPVLTTTYSRRYGVAVSQPAGPRSRRLLHLALAMVIAAMAASLTIRLGALPTWWALAPTTLAFAMTVVLGRRYDGALRDELAHRA
ncbi:hypothetical protein [Diaminobutyricimonas aerilata]|nr:hypothetical protein [Diaminobutyricimonas aerilata]